MSYGSYQKHTIDRAVVAVSWYKQLSGATAGKWFTPHWQDNNVPALAASDCLKQASKCLCVDMYHGFFFGTRQTLPGHNSGRVSIMCPGWHDLVW